MLTYNNMQPVQEAYFGKTKHLLEAERILGNIIKRFKVPYEKVGKRIIDAAKLNKSSENKALEEAFKRQFGFGKMVIHWDGSDTVNAYTIPRGFMTLIDSGFPMLPQKQSDGGYYDSKHSYLCVINIYAGLIDEDITPAEMVAVILHEIGHNFQCTPITNMATYTDFLWIPIHLFIAYNNISSISGHHSAADLHMQDAKDAAKAGKAAGQSAAQISAATIKHTTAATTSIVSGVISFFETFEALKRAYGGIINFFYLDGARDEVAKWFKKFDQSILDNQNKILVQWKQWVNDYREYLKKIEANKDRVAWKIAGKAGTELFFFVLFGPIIFAEDLYNAQTGYSGEVFSDSFATAYGYGPETVSVQAKFDKIWLKNPEFGLNKGNKNTVFNQYVLLMFKFMVTMTDPHPYGQTRMKNQINKLRRELESEEIPAEVKVKIKKDLDKAEKIYAAYLEMPDDFKHLTAVMNFNRINEMYFGGRMEIKEHLNRLLNFGKAEA